MKYVLMIVVAILFCITPNDLAFAQEIDLLGPTGLENWVKADGQPVDSPKWELGDGILHLTGGGGRDIFFREWIGDFVLTFEWRISEKGNSGIKYRVQKYGNSWLGCEYQLQDDSANPITKQSTASLYDVIEPSSARPPNPAGQWNTSKIVVIGTHIEHWLNGAKVVNTTSGSMDWLTKVNKSKFKPHPGWGQNPTGRLMLQDHGNEVWFRNMMLTRILAPTIACEHSSAPTIYPASCYQQQAIKTRRPILSRRRIFCRQEPTAKNDTAICENPPYLRSTIAELGHQPLQRPKIAHRVGCVDGFLQAVPLEQR